MSNTVFNNHPIINNSNQYFLEKKYISIHSEDRDISKYPMSSEFEILLPQEYLNVASAKLYSWSFPANYNVFSVSNYNVVMTFKFLDLYNPGDYNYVNILASGIFAALYEYSDKEIIVTIETGFYNPDQMATELTNQFNQTVTNIINTFFDEPNNVIKYADAKTLFQQQGGYNRFQVAYNSVAQRLFFGNQADRFILTNESTSFISSNIVNSTCVTKNLIPELVNWGLPAYLGFTRCNVTAYSVSEYIELSNEIPFYTNLFNLNALVPRFFYEGEDSEYYPGGIWISPDPALTGSTIYYLQAPYKICFMGPSYLYMEIDGWNCIDETSPYNLNLYTIQTNKRNSIVNSAFAKIPIPTTPISQWYDNDMRPYKYWNPVAERISKIKVKFRYHNGLLADFGQFQYSFMLELNILKPQQEKSYSIVNAFDLSQQQSYGSKFV
jgi:hypothetical protein